MVWPIGPLILLLRIIIIVHHGESLLCMHESKWCHFSNDAIWFFLYIYKKNYESFHTHMMEGDHDDKYATRAHHHQLVNPVDI